MELNDILHSSTEEIVQFDADLFIAASGYESRSICIPKKVSDIQCKKIALCFLEHKKDLARPDNDRFFKENNYEMIYESGHAEPDYDSIFSSCQRKELKVIVDISVMTRVWYHSIIKYFSSQRNIAELSLKVVYCPAIFSGPVSVKGKLTLNRLSMLESRPDRSSNQRKSALIMGLGNEETISSWVFNKLKPDKTYLLYADPSVQKEYVEHVFIQNHGLIDKISIKNLQGYPLYDTKAIYTMLVNLILPLRQDYKVIIVPQGPKIFSLIAMIVQMSYPDIELYYPQVKHTQLRDRKPFQDITAIDLLFTME